MIEDWTVVWGAIGGEAGNKLGQRKRRRAVGTIDPHSGANNRLSSAAVKDERDGASDAAKAPQGRVMDGKMVEDARLIVLHKEREGLAKLIGMAAGAQKRR